MRYLLATFALVALSVIQVCAQKQVDRVKFFTDTSVINATLSINYKHVRSEKDKIGVTFPAVFSCSMDDGSVINDHILVEVRGHFRRSYCDMLPLKLIYKKDSTCAFYKLKELKLVGVCNVNNNSEQDLLREYLTYKIYNLITDNSFRVRLLNLTYVDSSGRRKPITRHAFLMEDVKQLAKRNYCEEWSKKPVASERADRHMMTVVNIFEYMIGNTDWSVPGDHNIKLIENSSDSTARPIPVPYDFDSSGLVHTEYAAPDERLGIVSVRERAYRGFPRTMEELNDVLDIFIKQKANIYEVIGNCDLLNSSTKKDMIGYIDQFYRSISNKSNVKYLFIDNARRE